MSMIESDGRLVVSIPPNAVTWFSFLQTSRALNSKQGGWNSKSYWVKSGLDRLVAGDTAAAFLAQWTTASLDETALPKPRAGDFKIKERLESLAKGARGRDGTPTGENELNWNLSKWLRDKRAMDVPAAQRIATYELPLAAESTGQLKADVVVFDSAGTVEIVEMKDGESDSPLMALVEAICYALQLLRCWPELRKYLNDRFSRAWPETLHGIRLVLAGREYWNCCNPGRRPSVAGIGVEEGQKLRKIVKSVEAAVRSYAKYTSSDFSLTLTLADVLKHGAEGLEAIPIATMENSFSNGSIFASA